VHTPDLKRESADAAQRPTRLSGLLADTEATEALGAMLAKVLIGQAGGLVIYLDGDLGAGKTTLVRALLRALGHRGPVKSPTYALVELYEVSSLYLYHFDFYRFNDPSEFLEAGLDEYFQGMGICLVEWPEKAAGYLPPPDLRLALHVPAAVGDGGQGGRRVELVAVSERGAQCLSALA
jgi:tRNA threonylcarbamoyladenosine biosynthesis protein TsaE